MRLTLCNRRTGPRLAPWPDDMRTLDTSKIRLSAAVPSIGLAREPKRTFLVAESVRSVLFRRHGDRQIGAITERIRAVLSRQPGQDLCIAADSLNLPALDLARLFDAHETADAALVIDVITGLAYEAGVDPQWLLTGEYDGAAHRHVLMLGEDRTARGRSAVRDFVHEQYRRLRRDAMLAWWPGRRSARQAKARPADRAMSA